MTGSVGPMPGLDREVLDGLGAIVGPGHVLTDPQATKGFWSDVTGRFGQPAVVVRPSSTDQVAQVVKLLAAAGVTIVPQGGNTGLVGGSVPSTRGQVIMSTSRLTTWSSPEEGQLLVGAGVTLAEIQATATSLGYAFPVDIGSRGSATAGGIVAANARGPFSYCYGPTARHVIGLEVVLASSSVVTRLTGLLSDNGGYRWTELFAGSEGTLGVITQVLFRLSLPRPLKAVFLAGAASMPAAVEATTTLRDAPDVEAVEVLTSGSMRFVCESLGLPPPLRPAPPVYLLVAASGQEDPTEKLGGSLEELITGGLLVGDPVVADSQDDLGRARLWRYRHGLPEACNRHPPVIKLDITVPLTHYAEFVGTVDAVVTAVSPSARVVLFGHLSVGNIHVNVLGAGAAAGAVERAVLGLVSARGGSVAAEHGVGHAKAPFLGLTRSPEEIAVMEGIKSAFDPNGVFNPGAVLALA